jgi:5-methylcytosine-specific restriction endonuclease McrA
MICRLCRRDGVALYRTGNLERHAAKEARRRARRLDQTPELVPEEQRLINDYYYLSQQLGQDWQVDHIVPLSKNGLHHPDNLQIILAEDNFKKQDDESYQPKVAVRIR